MTAPAPAPAPALPQNCIVICVATFDNTTQALTSCESDDAFILPRSDIATLDGLKNAIRYPIEHEPTQHLTILTNVVVCKLEGAPPVLARVNPLDWERLCALHAWDFIYVEGTGTGDTDHGWEEVRTVRVSKGRWRIGE
ncbi:hypothetical protein K440DRAFT_632400 [Wilcoxina mikolae CBS 423.85]|nr:hypothetical protein K440DRAFT_632400 [Wilcoxina mikolae CBS 423.85]